MAAPAWEVVPMAPAAVKTPIRQSRPVAKSAKYSRTPIILESKQFMFSVADEIRVHQPKASNPCRFRPKRSKKASH
jgi:hypothetical protein